MKSIVITGLAVIMVALFTALLFLYRDRGHGKRMVWALTVRVGLSILLIAFMVVSYWQGWIGERGLR